jgi:tRNA nucleotidyltransferase (CCA-adding enzyme)
MMASMYIEHTTRLLEAFEELPAAAGLLPWLARAHGIHLVGGAIRDLMLGREPRELDFVVEGDVDAAIASLAAPVRSHDRFGTCTIELRGFRYDFAQARQERYARPGALPDVSAAAVAEDLRRRDFTVNAFALALTGAERGTLLAVDDAPADLALRQLRVLHDASFRDDPTRLLRLARYVGRLEFGIEPHTFDLAEAAVAEDALGTVSAPRVGAEMRLLAAEPDPVQSFTRLRELRLDAAIAPGFGLADPALARRAIALLADDGDPGALVIAAAALTMPPGPLSRLLNRLGFPAAERDRIVAAAGAESLARALERAQLPSELMNAIGEGDRPELVALAGALGPAEAARTWRDWLRAVRLEIDGDDLLRAGIAPGARIGDGLRAALAAKRDSRVSGREGELGVALEAATRG